MGGGGIIPQAEKANTDVMDALARILLTSYAFLYAKTFSGFEKIWNLIIAVENYSWVLKNVEQFFFS